MEMPESLQPHQKDYKSDVWQEYSFVELGWWIYLFTKRAFHRTNSKKRKKDLYDAQNYLDIMQAKLNDLK